MQACLKLQWACASIASMAGAADPDDTDEVEDSDGDGDGVDALQLIVDSTAR